MPDRPVPQLTKHPIYADGWRYARFPYQAPTPSYCFRGRNTTTETAAIELANTLYGKVQIYPLDGQAMTQEIWVELPNETMTQLATWWLTQQGYTVQPGQKGTPA